MIRYTYSSYICTCAIFTYLVLYRQLGTPTFFVSISAAESQWGGLLLALKWSVDGEHVSEDEALDLDWPTKCRLIKSDPVSRQSRHYSGEMIAFSLGFVRQALQPHLPHGPEYRIQMWKLWPPGTRQGLHGTCGIPAEG